MDDLRTPSGWFFLLTGAIVLAMGLFAPGERAPLAGPDVNVYSGLFMMLFGLALLALAYRAAKRTQKS